jgi:hypothetical protein
LPAWLAVRRRFGPSLPVSRVRLISSTGASTKDAPSQQRERNHYVRLMGAGTRFPPPRASHNAVFPAADFAHPSCWQRSAASNSTKSAQNITHLYINHEGETRCTQQDKSARGGTGLFRGLCRAQRRGKHCVFEGCHKSARGGVSLCTFHGGGLKHYCKEEDCSKSAQGVTTLCIDHTWGTCCTSVGCATSARGDTLCCRAHGGGAH